GCVASQERREGDAVATKYLYGPPMLTLPALAFVLVPALAWGAARKRWNAAAEIREPRTYTFSEDGVRVAAQTFESFTAWSSIAGAARVGEQVVLATPQQQFYLVPVRAFGDGEALGRFRRLIAAKVPGCRL